MGDEFTFRLSGLREVLDAQIYSEMQDTGLVPPNDEDDPVTAQALQPIEDYIRAKGREDLIVMITCGY